MNIDIVFNAYAMIMVTKNVLGYSKKYYCKEFM